MRKKFEKCPCCGYPTLENRYDNEICFLCEWEDDYSYEGPNFDYELEEARDNFKKYLVMFRSTDYKFKKFKNHKMDEIKREIISLYDAENLSEDIRVVKIDYLKMDLQKELDSHLKKYYEEKS